MRAAGELLDECARRGIVLTLDGDGDMLRYRPKTAMTPALLATLVERKPEILALLRRSPWPPRIDALLESGRALDRAVAAGEPADRARATAVVTGLAAYVDSLPAAHQASVARQLVVTLASQAPFEATAPLKRPTVVGAA